MGAAGGGSREIPRDLSGREAFGARSVCGGSVGGLGEGGEGGEDRNMTPFERLQWPHTVTPQPTRLCVCVCVRVHSS